VFCKSCRSARRDAVAFAAREGPQLRLLSKLSVIILLLKNLRG
jgi:hypothetical protein